jgi:hypothetical protein
MSIFLGWDTVVIKLVAVILVCAVYGQCFKAKVIFDITKKTGSLLRSEAYTCDVFR